MKLVKRAALSLCALLVFAVTGLAIEFYFLSPKMRPAVEAKAVSSPETIARGAYLANHVTGCTGCHSPIHEGEPGEPLIAEKIGSGRDFGDHPELFPGRIRAPNLTPDQETGIGSWTDGELLRAMREGVSRDGRPLFPMMPYLTYAETLNDEDALAIVAYLRSLRPIRNAIEPMQVNFPISMFARAAPKPLEKVAAGEPAEPLARGQWLIKACSCADCHTTTNARHEPIPGRFLAGGNPFPIPGKGVVYTANLTSDGATGIGAYTDDDILRAITCGIGKSGRQLYGMPWTYYAGMTADDQRALVLALRRVPAVTNAVPEPELAK